MSAHPSDVDMTREPFGGEEIDPRVLGRRLDPTTGEIVGPRSERRMFGADGRADTGWPPLSRGPLPPRDRIPPDLNIGTAQDEIDAWAHEHDAATTELERVRRDRTEAQIEVMKARMKYRRIARQNPKERGRRTSDDIKDEVDEALASDPQYLQMQRLEVELETQMGRLFRAKDNIARLDAYVKSLPRPSTHRP